MTDVKPGMVIESERHTGYVLYIKTNKRHDLFYDKQPYINMFCAADFYDGPMTSIIDLKEKVKILTGKKRAKMIKDIQISQRRHIYELEQNLRRLDAFEMIVND